MPFLHPTEIAATCISLRQRQVFCQASRLAQGIVAAASTSALSASRAHCAKALQGCTDWRRCWCGQAFTHAYRAESRISRIYVKPPYIRRCYIPYI
eukprot:365220-Chlamydomonas_euryale.AAC.1